MNARLVAIDGPVRGSICNLPEGELTVGRESANQLSLKDPTVSRRHCVFRREAGRVSITDLGSANGVFVNGIPVHEADLEHGDEVRIGNSSFLYALEDAEDLADSGEVELGERTQLIGSTLMIRTDDVLYLNPEKLLAELPSNARVLTDLSALLKVSTAINSIRDPVELQAQLLEHTFVVVPAERGAILLADGHGEFTSVCRWNRASAPKERFSVSKTIIDRVYEDGEALLCQDVTDLDDLPATESLISRSIRSLIAVPLTVFKEKLGVFYLDASERKGSFSEADLKLVTAIASMAAVAIQNARHVQWLVNENLRLEADLHVEHQMIGESAAMSEVYKIIAKAAPTDATILICGESGTGKELAARAIHRNSPRAGKPFVAINCAALTETLLESELFGYEKGAFTGATASRKGKLEVADGGTVFLDEIGEISPGLQAKLLRVLQEHEFDRVGGTRPIQVDIRIVAATNKNLGEEVRTGRFRQDLFYRLNVVQVTMPPLRERREDIPLLASHFVSKYASKCKRSVLGISPEARGHLMRYDWPGNVRELENAIERAVVLGGAEFIMQEDLPDAVLDSLPAHESGTLKLHEALQDAKRSILLRAFQEADGVHNEAARLLGVHPNNLHRLLRNLNLRPAVKK